MDLNHDTIDPIRRKSVTKNWRSLFTKNTLRQMIAYGIVGGLEYCIGLGIISYLSQYQLPIFVSFSIQFVIVGYVIGFLLRKYWVFKA